MTPLPDETPEAAEREPWHWADARLNPAPEAAPTASEREHDDGCLTEHTWDESDCNCRPAEPDAGDVEALAEVIERAENPLDDGSPVSTYGELARAVLASDWLASLLADARREGGDERAEKIAQAIGVEADESHAVADESGHHYDHAARIARSTR